MTCVNDEKNELDPTAMAVVRRISPAAVVLLIVFTAVPGCHRPTAREKFYGIAPRARRTIEARLMCVGWSAMHVQRSIAPDLTDADGLELAGAAGAVINSTANDSSPQARHDAGIACLLIGRDSDAVDALQAAVTRSANDAEAWSDLAAARYTLATRGDLAYELPRALADADHALLLRPDLQDALFNRALIIERLGVVEAARRAWQRYAAIDRSSAWSTEALLHLGRLHVGSAAEAFKRDLSLATKALQNGNSAPVAALTRTYPQDARIWGEGPLLTSWADAADAGKTVPAQQALRLVREIGRALVETNHDHLLADTVASIDGASTNPARVHMLIEADQGYRDGRILLSKHRSTEAQPYFEKSAALFANASSPMADMSRYYLASALQDENRATESHEMLARLLAHVDRTRYRALYAQLEWLMGLRNGASGEWELAIHSEKASRASFATLGEVMNRSAVDVILADALDRLAQPRAAWKVRVGAFATLSGGGSTDRGRIPTALTYAIRSEAKRGDYEAALAVAKLTTDELRQTSDPISLSLAFTNRARLLAAAGNPTAARQSITDARVLAGRVPDASLRARLSVLAEVAAGTVVRDTDPLRAIALFSDAIAFFNARNEAAFLPDIFLQRGRTQLLAHNDAAALADFEAGLRQLDALRSSFDEGQLRSTFYDTEPDLFGETIALLLRRGKTAQAFALADGARARSLYEQLGTAPRRLANTPSAKELRGAIPQNASLLEYALLHDAIAIFYVTPKTSGVRVVPVKDAALRASVERFGDLLQRRADLGSVNRQAASLFQTLIAPVAEQIDGTQQLIIVPDRELHSIPFGALFDATQSRYLVDRFTISIAPSAAFALRRNGAQALAPVLVVGDPKSEGAPVLPDAVHEAELIAAMYDSPTLLVGERATRARFIESVQRSAIVHYAGHAQSDTSNAYGTLALASDDDRKPGDLDASDIARLQLRKAPLVVLAACGTIRGDADHVEGMPSVARAFLAAGARGVIGTLWEVDDDTASRLFRGVHRRLRARQSAAVALRQAQIDLIHGSDAHFRHPSTWAPVEFLGNN